MFLLDNRRASDLSTNRRTNSNGVPSLPHFQPQKPGLGARHCVRVFPLPLVEEIAAFIKVIYLRLAFLIIVCMLLDAACSFVG